MNERRELYFIFIALFSRLEFALKKERLLQDGRVMASLEKWVTEERFRHCLLDFSASILITDPPRALMRIGDQVDFESVDQAKARLNTKPNLESKLLASLLTLRNNLFHGEKGNFYEITGSPLDRDLVLVQEGIKLLEVIISVEPVKSYFNNGFGNYLS